MDSSTVLLSKWILSARDCAIPAKKLLNDSAIPVFPRFTAPLTVKASVIEILGWSLMSDFKAPQFFKFWLN